MAIVDGNVVLTFTIHARPETVFSFFIDPERFARWWAGLGGGKATIDPREGGEVRIDYQNGHVMSGKVVTIDEPRKFVFTWGYHEEDKGLPPGSSQVSIELEPVEAGTALTLRHSGLPAGEMLSGHESGWRHYMSTMAAECAKAEFGGQLVEFIDDYFKAWMTDDDDERRGLLERTCVPDVRILSDWACLDGVSEVHAQIGNARRHMPGVTIGRVGDPALSHNHARCAWAATMDDGTTMMAGENVFRLAPDGRIELVVGFVGIAE
jgi:uncharacterized protein YndB with AHSA1/START domain